VSSDDEDGCDADRSPLELAAAAAATLKPVAVRLHASSFMPGSAVLSCRAAVAGAPALPAHVKPPAEAWITDGATASAKAEAEWESEKPLSRAQRQKIHWRKDEVAMSDGIFYKHLRDHNLAHAEAQEEVKRRKWFVREGKANQYAPPEMGRPVLGLLNGQPVPYPKMPPGADDGPYADWIRNPWATYLAQRPANEVTKLAAAYWNAS